jgi:predicted dehydrogenase
MKDTLNMAMLGCGAVADLYLPAFKYLEHAEVIAVIDIDRLTAEEIAEKYGVPGIYTDAAVAAGDEAIDAVIIGTPPDLHAEHIALFAQKGKHILCEKPMAADVKDCQRIIDACSADGVKLQIGHMKRFMRGNQKVKAIIDSGALGKIFVAECHWDCAVPQLIDSYREKSVTLGGSLQDHGPHSFDLVRWWTGNDILEVSATIRSVHPKRPAEDACVAVLEHEHGMFSYHHMTRISYGREHTQDTYRIYGTEGTLVVRNDHHFPTMSLESPEIILYRAGECTQRFETRHGWNIDDVIIQNFPFYNQLESFCESIRENSTPRVTGEDGKHVIECVVAAYISSLSGVKVKLPLHDDVNLAELFQAIKKRDAHSLKYDYDIEVKPQPPLQISEHVLGHRPPYTKEKWSDKEHGMAGQAELEGLQRRLKKTTESDSD